MAKVTYHKPLTALLVIDPYNDFISEGGKVWGRLKAVAEANGCIPQIGRDGRIVLIMPYVEMGQGTYTSIPMLIAEELEVDLSQVRLEHAPPNEKLYVNPLLGVQATGNSNAVRASWQPLREAGATARTMLVAAAAKRWNVDPASCYARSGVVHHKATRTKREIRRPRRRCGDDAGARQGRAQTTAGVPADRHASQAARFCRRRSTEAPSMASTFGRPA